ncbi:MAG TPA: MarR family transcriptional regulator [Chloroflexota bacterium]|nr:MarR family transcriptional regulator [Chloroflexota bacterium]
MSIRETLAWELIQVNRAHRNLAAECLGQLGLHVGQEVLLSFLWEEDGLAQSDLAERLGVEPPTVTKMLERMERTCLVERRRDPLDARVSRAYLTEKGKQVRQGAEACWSGLDARLIQSLSLEERLLLRRLLREMRGNLI